MAKIRVMELQTGAGGGIVVHEEKVESTIEFPVTWLRERGLRPSDCRIVSVVGESMEPTLADGCAILVDLSSRSRRSRRIYVVLTEDELVVKRAVLDQEAGWLLVSDNQDGQKFPSQPWPDEARIIGEVRWHGQSFS